MLISRVPALNMFNLIAIITIYYKIFSSYASLQQEHAAIGF